METATVHKDLSGNIIAKQEEEYEDEDEQQQKALIGTQEESNHSNNNSSSSSSKVIIEPDNTVMLQNDDRSDSVPLKSKVLTGLDIEIAVPENENEEQQDSSPSKRKGRTRKNAFLGGARNLYSTCICCPAEKSSSSCSDFISRHTPYRVGNCFVLVPFLFERTGYGMVGPHVIGLMFTHSLIAVLSYLTIRAAWLRIGYCTTIVCSVLTISCFFNLFRVSFRDPGIVLDKSKRRYHRKAANKNVRYHGLSTTDDDVDSFIGNDDDIGDESSDTVKIDKSNWKWCDMCKVFQPPTGAHCTICNVCVTGYDHHCPWMGCCVGEKNLKAFAMFNVSWFIYALYALFWVSFLSRY